MEDYNSGPGLSCYVIGFEYKGCHFYWSIFHHLFMSGQSDQRFDTLPIGAYNLEISFNDPEDEE